MSEWNLSDKSRDPRAELLVNETNPRPMQSWFLDKDVKEFIKDLSKRDKLLIEWVSEFNETVELKKLIEMYEKGNIKTFVNEDKVPTIKELAGEKLI